MPNAQSPIPDALCFHCNNNNQFKQIHKQAYEAVFMPVSWQIKYTNKMMIVDAKINEMKIERFKIVHGLVAGIM